MAEWLTIAEAAEALGVSKDTIRRRIKAGKIPAEKRPGPHGVLTYYILDTNLSEAAEVITITREGTGELEALIRALMLEVRELRKEVKELKLLEPPKESRSWWQRITGK